MNRFPNVSLLFVSLFCVLGDGITTYLLLVDPTIVESKPTVLAMLDVGGFARFAIAKLTVLAISIGLFVLVDRIDLKHVEFVPMTWCFVIGLMGWYATYHNLGLPSRNRSCGSREAVKSRGSALVDKFQHVYLCSSLEVKSEELDASERVLSSFIFHFCSASERLMPA
jgi:hypothetical protein